MNDFVNNSSIKHEIYWNLAQKKFVDYDRIDFFYTTPELRQEPF